jgi:hypothetical protein
MTVAYVSVGTVGTGSTSATAGTPASLATGDGVLLHVVAKPDTATINTPAGWSLVSSVAGGGGTTGAAVGPTRQATFFREKDAGWTTVPAVSVTSGSACAAIAERWTKDPSKVWDLAGATSTYGSGGTTTNGAATMGSDPGIANGDGLSVLYSSMSVTPTWSAQNVTATGATIGSVTERSEAIETTTGNDVGGMVFTAMCTAGTSSAAPVTAATASAATRGTVSVNRLREIDPPPPLIPPDRISYNTPASGNFSSAPASFTTNTFDVVNGDLIVVMASTEAANTNANVTPSASGGSVTWTLKEDETGGATQQSAAWCWYGEVGATASGITVTVNRPTTTTTTHWGMSATVYRNHGGVGVGFTGNNGQVTPSAPGVAATVGRNSALQVQINDWNAADGTSRTWRTINGAAQSESLYYRDAARHSVYGGYTLDTGSGGSVTQGLTAPTGMRWVLVGIEILGVEDAGTTQVTSTRALQWSTKAQATGTRALQWRVRSQVTGARALLWDALGQVTGSRALQWKALARVTGSRALIWGVGGRVTSTRALLWDMLTPATSTRALVWDALGSVTGSRALLWRTRAQVTGSRALIWGVGGRVTSTRALLWDVLGSVTGSRSLLWNVLGQVTSTRALLWDALSRLTSTRALLWDVLVPVTSTRALLWRVRTSATGSRSLLWAVKARVTGSRALVWTVNEAGSVTSARQLLWNTKATVTGSRILQWDTFTTAASSRALRWDTLAAVTRTRALLWRTLGGPTSARTLIWDVAGAVTSSRALLWSTRARATSTRTLLWDTRFRVVSDRELQWRTLEQVTASRTLEWEVIGQATSEVDLAWRTLEQVTGARILRWRVNDPFNEPFVPMPTPPGRILSSGGTRRVISAGTNNRVIPAALRNRVTK